MSTLCLSSRHEVFLPITLNLANVDLCRYEIIENMHCVRVILSSGVEDLIPFSDFEDAKSLVTNVSRHRGDPSDTCYEVRVGRTRDDEAEDEYLNHFKNHEKIQAIKRYKHEFEVQLKTAKTEVEDMMEQYHRGDVVKYPSGRLNSERIPY